MALLSQEALEARLGPDRAAGHSAGERLPHLQEVQSGFFLPWQQLLDHSHLLNY